ncbi:MAG: hypothetical protein R3F54_11410 [Alphaproteobacteria bacterium]
MSRQQAATEQLEEAIDCFFDGALAAAITLAGAVEGMFQPPEDGSLDLFSCLKRVGAERGHDESSLLWRLNVVRNWLKHSHDEDQIRIEKEEAMIMLVRAITRYTSQYEDDTVPPKLTKFGEFLEKDYPNWIADQ